jgi:tripartite-type tricarboxylate transporter receptor subunit TctC
MQTSARYREPLVMLAAALLTGSIAQAQSYPAKPVRVVIGFAAGSSSDVVARIISPKLTELLGQTVVVDTRPGAAGNVAAEHVAKSAPDGYTLLFPSASIAIGQSYYRQLGYSATRDLLPVSMATSMANLLCVNPSLPVKSLKELIALSKSRPGEVMYSSAGTGSADHMSTELLGYMAGLKIRHVPYKGGPQALNDVISGEIAFIITGLPVALPQANAGRVRALAVTTAARTRAAPNIPTVAEAGLPGYEQSLWNGLFAPAGTPPAVVARLGDELKRALQAPDVQQRFATLGIDVVGSSPAEFDRFFRAEVAKWAKVIKATGLQGEL